MPCASCIPDGGLSILDEREVSARFGTAPRASEATCRACGTRWVLIRPPRHGDVRLERASNLIPTFEGRWSFSEGAGRPGEGEMGGYVLVLARSGDRLSGEFESRHWNDYAREESMRTTRAKVEGSIDGDVARIVVTGASIWLDRESRGVFFVKPGAKLDWRGEPERCLFAAASADAVRHHEADVVFTPDAG